MIDLPDTSGLQDLIRLMALRWDAGTPVEWGETIGIPDPTGDVLGPDWVNVGFPGLAEADDELPYLTVVPPGESDNLADDVPYVALPPDRSIRMVIRYGTPVAVDIQPRSDQADMEAPPLPAHAQLLVDIAYPGAAQVSLRGWSADSVTAAVADFLEPMLRFRPRLVYRPFNLGWQAPPRIDILELQRVLHRPEGMGGILFRRPDLGQLGFPS